MTIQRGHLSAELLTVPCRAGLAGHNSRSAGVEDAAIGISPMKPRVLTIGTFHAYQMNMPGWNKQCGAPQFKLAMEQIVAGHAVDYLVEELNIESLVSFNRRMDSWLEVIAREGGIGHCFLDPDTKERLRIGIEPDEALSPENVEMRERYWLDRIRERTFKTALCVIGAAHIRTFTFKLGEDYSPTILIPRYDPNHLDPREADDNAKTAGASQDRG